MEVEGDTRRNDGFLAHDLAEINPLVARHALRIKLAMQGCEDHELTPADESRFGERLRTIGERVAARAARRALDASTSCIGPNLRNES